MWRRRGWGNDVLALSNDAEGDASLVEAADDLLRQGASYAN